MDATTTTPPRVPLGRLVFGLVLLLVGILSVTDQLDLIEADQIWRFWPVFLIVIGVSSELDSLRTRAGGGGYIVAAIGVWLLIANHRFMGLTHRTAFPIAIAIAGLGVMLHALIDDPEAVKKAKKENE